MSLLLKIRCPVPSVAFANDLMNQHAQVWGDLVGQRHSSLSMVDFFMHRMRYSKTDRLHWYSCCLIDTCCSCRPGPHPSIYLLKQEVWILPPLGETEEGYLLELGNEKEHFRELWPFPLATVGWKVSAMLLDWGPLVWWSAPLQSHLLIVFLTADSVDSWRAERLGSRWMKETAIQIGCLLRFATAFTTDDEYNMMGVVVFISLILLYTTNTTPSVRK